MSKEDKPKGKVKALRPDDFTPEMLLEEVLEDKDLKLAKHAIVITMDEDGIGAIWATHVKTGDVALAGLKLQAWALDDIYAATHDETGSGGDNGGGPSA